MKNCALPTMYFDEDFDHISGIYVCANSFYEYHPHRHDFYEFECITEGCAEYILNNKSQIISAGDIVCTTPTDTHSYRKINNQVIKTITVHFNISGTGVITPALNLKPGIASSDKKLYNCFLMLQDEYNNPIGQYTVPIIKNLTERIILLYMQGGHCKADDPIPDEIAYAVGYIRKYYNEKINLEQISASCGYSPSYFCKRFKKYTGSSFVEYLNNIRVIAAANLLQNKSMSVMQVCCDCGFGSLRHFDREFSRKYGCSPSQYRVRQNASWLHQNTSAVLTNNTL